MLLLTHPTLHWLIRWRETHKELEFKMSIINNKWVALWTYRRARNSHDLLARSRSGFPPRVGHFHIDLANYICLKTGKL